jgi:hypothetical protein
MCDIRNNKLNDFSTVCYKENAGKEWVFFTSMHIFVPLLFKLLVFVKAPYLIPLCSVKRA